MIKKIAWDTFKKTGNIDTMMELIKVEKESKNIEEKNEKVQKDVK